MASIEISAAEAKTTKRKLHPSLRVDMTPMVDLGFLLITFFILTTSMMEKRAMKLVMPTEDGPPGFIAESKVLTVLLGKDNRVYTYEGRFEDAQASGKIISTTYDESTGIGQLIREKQEGLQSSDKKEGREALIFLIKPMPESSYKNVIDALDETTINGVKKFILVDATEQERAQVRKMN